MPAALAEKVKTASIKLSGERRAVTVLLVDMADFTTAAAADTLEREEIYLLIDETVALLADAAYKYGGTIDKFTGDGLAVIFGAPTAHENDPELAIRAALQMLTAVQDLHEHPQEAHNRAIQVRIGICTGEVIAGRLGSDLHMEYTAIGQAVDQAIHLKHAAKPGTVLVSREN
jgi:adenylate cyclase